MPLPKGEGRVHLIFCSLSSWERVPKGRVRVAHWQCVTYFSSLQLRKFGFISVDRGPSANACRRINRIFISATLAFNIRTLSSKAWTEGGISILCLDQELGSRKDVAIVYAIRALDKEQSIRSEMDPHPKEAALTKRILLVDSQEDQRLILGSLLGEEGHQVTICDRASEALDLFENKDFDFVIVVDLPPVLDGLHLLEQVKQLKTKIPVLVISSQYETELCRKQLLG